MDHRVTVTICGNEYTFVAEEDSTYVEKVAAYVDRKMTETLEATKAGQTDAAVLTAADRRKCRPSTYCRPPPLLRVR